MEDFWVALGIILMLLPVLLYIRSQVYEANVLLVPIYGEIDSYTGKLYAEMIREGKDYDAVVLEISSPGGTLSGVLEIIDALEELKKENKTIVAYIKGEATSGAYWVASYCDYIIAEKLSLIGNIGVSASFLNFAGLLKMLNISYIEIHNGTMKEMGNPFKEPREEEIRRLREIVNKIYLEFLNSVARNRNLTEKEIERIKTSDIFLPEEALKLKLIDKIGDFDDVKELLKTKLKKKEIKFEYPSLLRRYL